MRHQNNEDDDKLAKQAAQNQSINIPYKLEKPKSNLKTTIKELIIKQLQFKWDYGHTSSTT